MSHSGRFNVDRDGFTNVYTDGACASNGRQGASAGKGVYFGDGNPYNVSAPVSGRQTNNSAEIQAVTEAARQARAAGIENLRINTDSDFLKKSATEWMPRWERNGWQTAAGHSVVNKEEFQEMNRELSHFKNVDWQHVKGHSGNRGNEMADRYARDGANRRY